MNVHWHRRDLRASDNRALAEAARGDGSVLPVFVFDPEILAHASPPRVAVMLDALESLRADYRELGGDLLVVRGDPREEVPRIAESYDADAVYWNRDYSGLARERDNEVRLALDDAGVSRAAYHDALHHEPGSIRTNKGEHYSVYTYFWKKWRDREKDAPYDAPEEGEIATPADAPDLPGTTALPSLADLGFDEPEADVPPAGTGVARGRLADFREEAIFRYAEDRDYPARDATSRLSPHLKWGTIGIREVWWATEEAMDRADGDPDEEGTEAASVREFQSQLAWREFYAHVLSARPDVVTRNYKSYENDIDWREDEEALRAWRQGKTGYPIVDAAMRQLREEAYMHNRLRMVVASFLTKDLLLDWREGYDWFREKLADHDTGNDTGGWQWAASTGTDAQPYFRVFNPMTQGERYDPDCEFVEEYVPELEAASPDDIHGWHELSDAERERIAPDYPAPIVDHSERREEAIAMFEAARGDD
ncbi:DNA photolyase family protein [Halorussus gelatinilyticus]|uniref:DNA photolyase family protein n=1 Tax=Halorussus gelatinilyticus TaxID=2937524 RepID=A0A8U0IIB1_9EURY|nr:deoxyribodipyrimidine photo-lyase [Halorussus gelatinilyticus]UPW00014.1 DNA photolyase family protein [Halorussus gelatinilyticus]